MASFGEEKDCSSSGFFGLQTLSRMSGSRRIIFPRQMHMHTNICRYFLGSFPPAPPTVESRVLKKAG